MTGVGLHENNVESVNVVHFEFTRLGDEIVSKKVTWSIQRLNEGNV